MHLVSCDTKVKKLYSVEEDFSSQLAELVEYGLMSISSIDGIPWHEKATDVLDRYHQSKMTGSENPLWRTLYEGYCSSNNSYSPNIVFMQLIRLFKDEIKNNFPNQEINRNILLDYLELEIEKAMKFE